MKPESSAADPLWYKDAVVYEVPVRSFFDSSGDGVGDFPGLSRKLDYLQELGITCIWLMPFYPSPLRDDGYDVADYRDVHPAYGTVRDLQHFLGEAHRHGMRVVAEMVMNHTSDQHPWFQAARTAPPGSPPRDFYTWSDSDEKYSQAPVLFPESNRSNWTWDPVAKAYYWHRFFPYQPDLNYENPVVREEMLKIMHFWLNLGLDGFCLNAVPYLIEREGTACENLPETHEILREIRRSLDATYPGRLLLAGVDQWPATARSYFGEGDECHVIFHLPLMHRLFMALRQEDRHPITEVLRQTPEIPAGCQWGILLRNQDEVTLRMATDEERDYMYREYAADPQMRLNRGIRRRLAPLVDNSRRRIELLFSLLFSLPGTPVLYYGDEIGMGDNVFLGDRKGVRTPMQWTGDRNAGFSEADFARLYSPPVMDPLYGYPSVNVEAQKRDPSSLLHWVRRIIGLRKRSPALVRGTMEILSPRNRKVFAYVRRYREEVLLVAANLSRFVQPVELDLAEFTGLFPVEMIGGTEFPRITEAPYFLSLGPHTFYWFRLQKTPPAIAERVLPVATDEVEEIPSLELTGGWETLLEGAARETLEKEVLPHFLPAQRWFGGKARRVNAVRVADRGVLLSTATPAYLVLIEVEFADHATDLYFLPLAVATGPEAVALYRAMQPRVLARLQGREGEGVLYDALAGKEACGELLSSIGTEKEFSTTNGVIRGFPTTAFAELRGEPGTPLTVAPGPATSSNSLVLYGRRLLLKAFRRLEVGINPDLEIGRFLTEHSTFRRIPRVGGALEYRRAGTGPVTLAILQQLIPNQGDGWRHAIEELGRYFERASARMYGPDLLKFDPRSLVELADSDPPPGALETIGAYLHAARTLGKRTAELHLALADAQGDAAFSPEPLTPTNVSNLMAGVQEEGRQALTALQDNLDRLPPAVGREARRLLEDGTGLLKRLAEAPASPSGLTRIRCHGDYHLGQVLWVENDFIILDFEGEPVRTVEERRAKQSPLKDVAGMLRSFHYAAYAGLFTFTQNQPGDFERLEPWADLWQRWTSAAFLKAYRATANGATFIPRAPEQFLALLKLFMLDKALYELVYELNNRPEWVRIPLRGILSLFEQEFGTKQGE